MSRIQSSLSIALRAALVASTVCASSPAANAGSTKFIPTFLVYYGGGPALTSADAPRLAKFDLLDTDRFRYNQIGSNTWASIKAYNPSIEIYLYLIGPEFYNFHDSYPQVSLNDLGRYDVSRGHPMGSLDGNHPELFLKDTSGRRIYSVNFSNPGANQFSYLMDFGSSAYQSYWVTAAVADIVNQSWRADGVFADNCLTFSRSGGYSATAASYSTDTAWSSAMNAFSGAIAAGLHNYGQKLWCNKGDTGSAAGSSVWLALDSSASRPDVLLEEGAFAVMWGAAVQFFPEAMWKQQVDTIAATANSKVATMSHTQLSPGGSGTDNWGKPVTFWQALWYSLGSFLLAKNDTLGNAYFMFNGGSGYDTLWWFDEYDKINLGKALGPYQVTNAGGVNVYLREFEQGYVAVNPTANNSGALALPQPSQQLTHDTLATPASSLPIVTSVSLAGHNAVVLLKTSATQTADTIPPSVPTGLTGTAVSPSQINLKWNTSADNVGVTGYYVYLNDAILASVTGTSYQHTGLVAGTYNYRVSAFDAAGNNSAWTATPVSVTTPSATPQIVDTQAPTVPAGLTANAVSSSQINLKWNAASDNVGVTGYCVYLNGSIIAKVTGTSFQHTGLRRNTTYNYRVSSFDAAGNNSAWTSTVSARTRR